MSLELSGTTPAVKGVAGSVSAPAITGDDANTGISFPAADTIKFSAGGVEKFAITASGLSGDGSGLSGISGGKFASYALLAKVQPADSSFWGALTTGAWRTRDLDTEKSDVDGIVSIASNQFTLQAGNYYIIFGASMYHCNAHALRLQNITDSTTAGVGNPNSGYTYSPLLFTTGTCRVSITGAKVFEVQSYVQTTKATNGRGFGMVNGSSEEVRVEIFKES